MLATESAALTTASTTTIRSTASDKHGEENLKDGKEKFHATEEEIENATYKEEDHEHLNESKISNPLKNSSSGYSFLFKPNSETQSTSNQLTETINTQNEHFYQSNRLKFIHSAVITRHQDSDGIGFDMNNEESFKEIYRFTKSQTTRLERGLSRLDLDSFNKTRLKVNLDLESNQRLTHLLESKHLRNYRNVKSCVPRLAIKNESANNATELTKTRENDEETDDIETQSSDEEDSDDDGSNHRRKKKFTSNAERLYYKKLDEINLKRTLVNSMYNQAHVNQEKSTHFITNSVEKYLLNKQKQQQQREKHSSGKQSSQSQANSILFDQNHHLIQRYLVHKEKIDEKSDFDVSRNPNNKNCRKYSFKIITNPLNSKYEIFKPVKTNPNNSRRSKSSMNSSSRILQTETASRQNALNNSKILAESHLAQRPKTSLELKTQLVKIPLNIDSLYKQNVKCIEAKCLSTNWRNYAIK